MTASVHVPVNTRQRGEAETRQNDDDDDDDGGGGGGGYGDQQGRGTSGCDTKREREGFQDAANSRAEASYLGSISDANRRLKVLIRITVRQLSPQGIISRTDAF